MESNKKKTTIAILVVLYEIIVYFTTVIFFMHRNWLPENMEEYQTELDFMIQELGNYNPKAYIIFLLNLVSVFIVCFYLYVGIHKIVKKLRLKNK